MQCMADERGGGGVADKGVGGGGEGSSRELFYGL